MGYLVTRCSLVLILVVYAFLIYSATNDIKNYLKGERDKQKLFVELCNKKEGFVYLPSENGNKNKPLCINKEALILID